MVALRLLISGALLSVASAAYNNDTTASSSSTLTDISSSLNNNNSALNPLPAASNSSSTVLITSEPSSIPSLTANNSLTATGYLNTTATSTSTTTPTAAFENIKVYDTLSESQTSTDPNHWFVIIAELSVSQGFSGDLYLTVPEQFGNFPEGTFDVLADKTPIGTVSYNDSKIFTVSFDNVGADYDGSFNFLAQLEDKPSSPTTVAYTFDVSSGPSFVSSVTYAPKSTTLSTGSTGVDSTGRPYFALDIPYTEYPGDLEFLSYAEDNYLFDDHYFQIVLETDSFNNPIRISNITAGKDNSDDSTISYSFNSNVSGGQAFRIIYYLSVDNSISAVKNSAQLRYPTLSFYKRDISIIFDTIDYLKPVANIDISSGKTISVLTNSQSSSINSTNTTTSSIAPVTSSITFLYPNITSTAAPYNNGSLTFTVITRTDGGVVSELTELVPVSTQATINNSSTAFDITATDDLTAATEVLTSAPPSSTIQTSVRTGLKTRTLSGEETEIGSLVPVGTLDISQEDIAKKTEAYESTATSPEEVSTFLGLLGASTSTGKPRSIATQYSGYANRIQQQGLGSLAVALLALLL